jgi:hypothetical protein
VTVKLGMEGPSSPSKPILLGISVIALWDTSTGVGIRPQRRLKTLCYIEASWGCHKLDAVVCCCHAHFFSRLLVIVLQVPKPDVLVVILILERVIRLAETVPIMSRA